MENQTKLPALVESEKLQEIMQTAPQILEQNLSSKEKAIAAAENLKQSIAEQGMNNMHDATAAALITKIKATVLAMNERRKPFTQIVQTITKQFTGAESELKPYIDDLQKSRDDYATEKMRIQREKEAEQARQLAAAKEAIEVKSQLEIQYVNTLIERYANRKEMLYRNFNAFTLQTIDSAKDFLREQYKIGCDFQEPKLTVPPVQYLSAKDMDNIIENVMFANYEAKMKELTTEFQTDCRLLADKIESRRAELQALENAGIEEKARLQAEANRRAEAEAARLEADKKAAAAQAEQEAAIAAAQAQLEATVDASAAFPAETPKVKEGYEIRLKSNVGYLLLASFWHEKEGKNLAAEKYEKFTFDRIKRFCEAYALKNEEFINSPLVEVEYVEIFKAK